MASTESMDDDSFSLRVEKIFGSLAPARSSPWSLSGNEVEKREWRRDTDTSARDETPCSSSFDGFFNKDRRQKNLRQEVDDDGEIDGGRDRDEDEWEIRSSIGLDSTLDNEEEEDEFDKVAAGTENAGERLYMNDVTDRGSYLNLHNVIPNFLNAAAKDPRANHLAAINRLREDEAEAQELNLPCHDMDTEVKESCAKASDGGYDSHTEVELSCTKSSDGGQESHTEVKDSCAKSSSDAGSRPKSILKRKNNSAESADSKPQKRVRFDPSVDEASDKINYSPDSDYGSHLTPTTSRVPDYILNPSKYTRYSFDMSTEFNEESNTKAYMDLLNAVNGSKDKELESASGELPKSVTFIPKKKLGDVKAVNISNEIKENKEDDGKRSSLPVGIAAEESQMNDEMELETNATNDGARFKKPGRKYRTLSRSDDSDSDS